ncbi:MAG: hypothetical protein K0R65_2706 [Crocinitomicaceae bacterium]|jgi:hypothetical protein|nr:hypothetical protein [Crocinitomicaceae bacterium]
MSENLPSVLLRGVQFVAKKMSFPLNKKNASVS